MRNLVAEAKRRMRRRRVLVVVLAVLLAGGVAGAAVALTSSSSVQPAAVFQPAAACPITGGYYAYALPQDPAHPPAAGDVATSWGWEPFKHQVKVGDRMRVDGRLWQIAGIAAMPGVGAVGRPFYINGWPLPGQHISGNTSLTLCGRLVFRPVS